MSNACSLGSGEPVAHPSNNKIPIIEKRVAVEFMLIRTVRFGSLAVIQTDSSAMTALGWKADTRPGRMSALAEIGHSEALRKPDLNGS